MHALIICYFSAAGHTRPFHCEHAHVGGFARPISELAHASVTMGSMADAIRHEGQGRGNAHGRLKLDAQHDGHENVWG